MTSKSTDITHYQFFKMLASLPFIEQIILYGSRARGDAKERSDIDLAILCPRATPKNWLEALDIIDNADTLLKIDCIRLDQLSDESSLKKKIINEGRVLFRRGHNVSKNEGNFCKS